MKDLTQLANDSGLTTAGPWYVGDNHRIMVNKPERAFLHEGAPETICEMISSVSPVETTANAILIASAPDLLDALTGLIAEFDRYDAEMTERGCGHEDYGKHRDKARWAISKALIGSNNGDTYRV
jgi:hypothetical protein